MSLIRAPSYPELTLQLNSVALCAKGSEVTLQDHF